MRVDRQTIPGRAAGPITRRHLVQSAAGMVAATSLLAQVAAAESTPEAASGEWTFTDDRGVTVTLPKRPERIVADLSAAAPLWDFGIHALAVAGWTTSTDAAWGNVDRTTPVINAGTESGMPEAEALLALEPDLYVNITWSVDEPDDLWGFPDAESIATIERITPIVAISATGLADVNTARFAELAGLLGADLQSPELMQAKADYDAAVEAFSATAAKTADLASLFAYVPPEGVWNAAYPPDWADLAMYQKLGMTIVVPDAEPGSYWEELSREQALKYQPDVLFNSTREGIATPEQLQADPVFGVLPAIQADQIGFWNQDFIMSYQGLTAALTNMTMTLQAAKKVS